MKFSNWLAFATLFAIGLLLWELKDILLALFAGVVIAVALCTLIEKFKSKLDIPRPLALLICLTLIILTLGIGLTIIIPTFTKEFQQLLVQMPIAFSELWELITDGIDNLSTTFYRNESIDSLNQRALPNNFYALPDTSTLASGLSEGIQKILGIAENLGNGLIKLIFILSVSLMITIQPRSYINLTILLIPSFYRKRGRVIIEQCGKALGDWMVGVLISSFCVALLAGLGLSILGVKLVIANALLAGVLNIIPNLGPTISTIFPASIALLDSPWKALAVIGLYIVIQNLESYIITPSVMQHQVKLLPGLTLTAQFIFTVVFGPLGLLLALPLAVVLQVFIKEVVIHDLLDPWKKERLKG